MIKSKWVALLAPVLVALAAAPAAAQSFPNKPIRLVLPYAPGGATDFTGRTVAQHLSEVIGQQVVAENRTGSGGIPGTDFVVRSAPDGYTLVLMDPAIVINPSLLAEHPVRRIQGPQDRVARELRLARCWSRRRICR